MRRRQLLRKIATRAHECGMSVQQVRDKGPHTIYRVGSTQFSLPRHTEINELTARAVCKHLEGELGKGWWL